MLRRAREAIDRALTWRRHDAKWNRLVREHPLRYLFLEVTRRCNLACVYCGSDCHEKGSRGEIPASEWKRILGEIAADYDARKVMVAVTGGEALIRDDIFEIMGELHRLGFPYGMVTNGGLLDAKAAKSLVEVGIGSISLSMDAPPEINDRLRGKGCSAAVETAIGHLREAGFKGKLEIISTLTTPAVAHLDELRKELARLKVPMWRVAPVMPIGRAAKRTDLVPGPQEIRAILEYVLQARRDGKLPAPEFGEEGFLGNRFEGNVRPFLAQCRAGVTTGGILSDGRIGACPELGDAFVQGDAKKERFKEVWENRYLSLRDRSWTHKGECKRCGKHRQCKGGSMHLYPAPGGAFSRCLYLMALESEEKQVKAGR
ncbi:MAG TPA: radical SAM protein [Myxococcales bacterium]